MLKNKLYYICPSFYVNTHLSRLTYEKHQECQLSLQLESMINTYIFTETVISNESEEPLSMQHGINSIQNTENNGAETNLKDTGKVFDGGGKKALETNCTKNEINEGQKSNSDDTEKTKIKRKDEKSVVDGDTKKQERNIQEDNKRHEIHERAYEEVCQERLDLPDLCDTHTKDEIESQKLEISEEITVCIKNNDEQEREETNWRKGDNQQVTDEKDEGIVTEGERHMYAKSKQDEVNVRM